MLLVRWDDRAKQTGKRGAARPAVTSPLLPYALGLAASAATLAGGYATMRLRHAFGPVFGLCGGIVLGVALLDLVPQALALGDRPTLTLIAVMLGAALLPLAGRALPRLTKRGEHVRRHLGPASLTLHSVMDGAGIGLAFHLSPATGWSVAAAVLTHDLADGANVVGLSLVAGTGRAAWRWLALNALAPLGGVALGQHLHLPPAIVGILLALLAGVFVSLALIELLPRGLRANRLAVGLLTPGCGVALVYAWVRLGV